MKKKTAIHKTVRANRKIKLSGICKLLIFAFAVQPLSGCVEDDLSDTPQPDKGAVVITTDWTRRSSDAVLPDSYILRIGTEEQTMSGETNAFDVLFDPGRQNLLVYHHAEGITISGNTATVNTLPDGTLEPLPGYLFSAATELEIEKDDTLKVTAIMQQHIRSLALRLKLNPGDERRIAHTAATLTGVASIVDLTTGAISATETETVSPAFVVRTDGGRTRTAEQPLLSATLRLPGVIEGEKQILTLVLTLTDGSMQTVVTDLSEKLKNFGDDTEPLALNATLALKTPTGTDGTISGWEEVDNDDVTIH